MVFRFCFILILCCTFSTACSRVLPSPTADISTIAVQVDAQIVPENLNALELRVVLQRYDNTQSQVQGYLALTGIDDLRLSVRWPDGASEQRAFVEKQQSYLEGLISKTHPYYEIVHAFSQPLDGAQLSVMLLRNGQAYSVESYVYPQTVFQSAPVVLTVPVGGISHNVQWSAPLPLVGQVGSTKVDWFVDDGSDSLVNGTPVCQRVFPVSGTLDYFGLSDYLENVEDVGAYMLFVPELVASCQLTIGVKRLLTTIYDENSHQHPGKGTIVLAQTHLSRHSHFSTSVISTASVDLIAYP